MSSLWSKIGLSALLLFFIVALGWVGYRMFTNELDPKVRTIIYVPKTIDTSIEFWEVMKQGVATAAKEFGADVHTVGTDTELDVDKQIQLLEQAIEEKPDAIILAATDYYRLVPVAEQIKAAGITLITVDSGLNGGVSESFIATDNYEAGRKAAQKLIENIYSDDLVAIMNFVQGSATAIEREKGVRDALSQNGVNLVQDTLYSNGSSKKAYQLTVDLLRKQPQLKGIIGLNEPSTLGAGLAIMDMGLKDKVKLVGFDNSSSEVQLLENEIMLGTVIQKPFTMGYLAVKTALEVVSGHKVAPVMDTGSEFITKENMYTSENEKLMFPFIE
ncbi:ribose transport system substrate-binding protein [Paenibacillus sp. PastF-3]|uniref:substrate-binding domain-containing protein n=1 Tax=Paenibacillus sp. PastF-3 TaxID=2940626 RepID=UPI002476D9B4|nr:substrate-binding domain-containing protein [Paenibacillus sp. PastF-3]MDH6368973.1 ribose transport system substrate-binding protein [Paenibacillus sp. PastF-3]